MQDRAGRSGGRARHASTEVGDPDGIAALATVAGTAGRDFIHRAGDGLIAPPGYTDITGATEDADTIDGGKGKDIIYGDAGDDVITGGGGTDQLYGGAGYDHFVLNAASEIDGRAEYIDGGADGNFLEFTFGGFVDLGAATILNVGSWLFNPANGPTTVRMTGETLDGIVDELLGGLTTTFELTTAADFHFDRPTYIFDLGGIQGSPDADIIDLRGDNINIHAITMTISGGDGNDEIAVRTKATDSGHMKSFALDGGDGDDTLTLSNGVGTLTGDAGNDRLTGGGQADRIDGGADDDILRGGASADTLTGGTGADLFVYAKTKDSLSGQADMVTDFRHAEGDRIDLSRIDADTTQSGNQAFTLLAGGTFTGHAGELVQTGDGAGHTLLQGDVDGDGAADFVIALAGAQALVATDFIV